MKKISKILAVALCLVFALSMLPMVASAADQSVEFTVDSLGLEYKQYTAGTTTVDGIGVEWIQLGNYGNGIQMRDKEGNTSMFWNTSATPGAITKIEFTYNSVKSVYNDNKMIVNFGTEAKGADCAKTLVTAKGTSTYEIIPDGDYTFFYIEWDTSFSSYWDSIKVYYGETGSEPDIPDVPDVPEQPEKTIVDVATAVAGADGEEFTVKGVVTCVDSSNIYVQDATGGICVRMAEKPADIALGDTIIGTGTKAVYNGMPQLASSTYEKSEGATLTPKATTIDALTTSDVCTYVTISGLTVTDIFDNNGQYTTPNITLTDGTNEIQIYKAAVAKVDGAWAIKVGDVIDVTAAVGIHKETLQLRNTLASEIVLVGNETPDTPDTPDVPAVDIVDIKTALEAESGEFTVKGVVICIEGKNVYIQDATGGICVRTKDQPAALTLGYEIIATGEKSYYNGLPQLNNSTYEVPEYEAQELTAKETTIDALTSDDLCTYIKLSGLTITEIFDNDGAYTNPNVTVSDGTNEIQVYKAVMDKNEDGTWVFAVGDKVDVLAVVSCFNDKLQLRNTFGSEFTTFVADSEDDTENDNQDNTDDDTQGDSEDNTEDIPQTSDASIVAAALVATCAAIGLVVLTKKEQF